MKYSYFILVLLVLSSCGYKSAEYEALKAQNDSLLLAKQTMQTEIDGYFSAMNEIEQNIEKIKTTEGMILISSKDIELESNAREKINEDLVYLNQMLKNNREELDNLKAKIKKSSFKSAELERSLMRLSKALEAESAKVVLLEKEIAKKDSLIRDLGEAVEVMTVSIDSLKNNITKQTSKIKVQDETIHTAWYVFGTRKELKEQNITTSGGLFKARKVLQSDFNKNYFARIDARKTKTIPLFSTRAKILTSHPKSSYTLEKDNGNFVLLIVDTDDFWSVSRYLVIEVE